MAATTNCPQCHNPIPAPIESRPVTCPYCRAIVHKPRPAGKLSDAAREALRGAYATRGAHRGQLLARCPRSSTLAAAAWQGAMMVCNPYQVSIGAILFMSEEQRALFEEVKTHFESLPREYQIMAQRDREALEKLGVF